MATDKSIIDYILKHTDKNFEKVDVRLGKLDDKVDQILAFKWKVVGGSMALSFFITLAINLIALFFKP